MPFQRSGAQELGQRQLGQHGGAEVGAPAGPDEVVVEVGRGDQPAEPQPRPEGLGEARHVGDALGGHAVQRAHGAAVVPVLRVVVVLDHQPAPFLRPGQQGAAAGG
ncbi:hypothetical protein KGD82_19240 [Nocardiopsis eucommiae]|uniref:Uncharacterized protein n=1 Tax=Nocardiopsis eucommiae TaxID=2831970 RepID=A0A975L6T5_9ACTN|nr:hypothetical protein KGD82_19240 [Nocardiopsis eucommiae]